MHTIDTRENINSLKNSFTRKEFEIIKTINEKYDRAIYLTQKNDIKYIVKIKTPTQINPFEKAICDILATNSHPNIIKFIEYYQDTNICYSIYEYAEGTNLFEYIKKNNLSGQQVKNILIQIVRAVIFLHSFDIIHCDLKLDNIIINTKNGNIKIIDFDLSIISSDSDGYLAPSLFGTMQYIAPESYDLCIYSRKTDIWQIGIILYILVTKKFPHQNEISLVNSFSNLCRQNIFKHINLQSAKEIILDKYNDVTMYELLENMLSFIDTNRIDTIDILKKLI